MEFWNDIINTALLGTEKRQVVTASLPAGLQEAAALIAGRAATDQAPATDKEEQFLQLAAVAWNFRQSGMSPLHKEAVTLSDAPAESLPYCSEPAIQALNDILSEDNQFLLAFWLRKCAAARRLATPEVLPILLNRAVKHIPLQPDTIAVGGRRGEWLSGFNPAWQFSAASDDEDLWQTGTADQRKTFLRQMRRSDPAKAREMLTQSWPQENANTKAELLKQLTGTVGPADKEWLESLLSEKSQKVKDEALFLLKQLPGSAIIEQYWHIVRQAITLKREKALLGMVNKISLQVIPPATVEESIFKTGVEKLSSTKEYTDEESILCQLIRYIPPPYWETHLALPPEAIIGHFQKEHPKYLSALVNATVQFGDARWALSLMQHSDVFYIDIIPLLPVQQQEYYSIRYCEKHAEAVIRFACQRDSGWNLELTKAIFKHTAKNPYQYNISFYRENIHRIPATIVAELGSCGPEEVHLRTMWNNHSEQLIRLIGLKEQTHNAFNE